MAKWRKSKHKCSVQHYTLIDAQTFNLPQAITICNDTLSTDAGRFINNKVFKNLAVNTHLLPALNFSYLQIAIRETQESSGYFGIILQLKFKKV
ncbi:hypothetical protein BOX11_gp37 [Flavobacterium phage 1H]|uniref:Uncharacterized protein n=1 Tax=Flavobacterium phage 1H TaxID=1792272 RepID=A0A1B0WMF9_9CAUD|nr:hypothetical protein BOX11_gp37 [Flavobacterium phage 1H]ANB41066.1 hypothetical protein [Flavobacterium phage 1H]